MQGPEESGPCVGLDHRTESPVVATTGPPRLLQFSAALILVPRSADSPLPSVYASLLTTTATATHAATAKVVSEIE